MNSLWEVGIPPADEEGNPWPLVEQPVQLEAIPNDVLARVFEAHGVQTWADVEAWFTDAMLLIHKGVGRNALHWLRCELSRRRRAVKYSASGKVHIPVAFKLPLPERSKSRAGVYFIQLGPFVKIGMAKCVRKRFVQLQQVIPFHLELLGVIEPGDGQGLRDLERDYHSRFESAHQIGEWFRLEGELDVFCLALARGEVAA